MLKKKKFRICQATKDRNIAVIVNEKGDEAESFVLTHNPKKAKDTYHKLHVNPNPNDQETSYIMHRIRKGKIGDNELYSTITVDNYSLSKQDDKELNLIYLAKKEGKPWNNYLNKNAHHTREIHQNTLITGKHRNNDKGHKRKKARKKKKTRSSRRN